MNLHIHGDNVPGSLLETLGAIADRSILDVSSVVFDESACEVRCSIIRFPLLKERKTLGNVHDLESPIPAVMIIREVASCDLQNHVPLELEGNVRLMFGVSVRNSEVVVSSTEEDHGVPCFLMTLSINRLDVQVTDAD